jgi:hypothetical protein
MLPPSRQLEQTVLAGLVERVTYHAENGFAFCGPRRAGFVMS